MDPRQKVTCGEAVVAMVLNTLGFVDRPLYLFPEFMATKPVEILIREDNLPVFIQALKWQYLGQEPFQRDCEGIWAVIAGEVGRRQDMGLGQCGIFGEESARNF